MDLTMSRLIQYSTLATAVGCGLAAGVFFAFSAFIMPALHRLPAAQGIAAMNSINKLAVTPAFMSALFLTALGCAALGSYAIVHWGQPGSAYVLAGAVLYLVGAIGLTMGYHVPLNDSLATVHPTAATAAGHWNAYVTHWTAWNHVRSGAALVSAALFTIALRVG